jgi:hypothetical protein
MNFHSFVIVLMAGIMVIGGGILIAMLVLESPRWTRRSWLGYASTSIRRLRRAGPSDLPWSRKKAHRRMVASPGKPPAAP